MPRLGALPVELMLLVLMYTDPDDLESLSRINSSWYRTAADLLRQHKEKKARYTRLDYDHCWRDLVICILRDPDIAHYIKDIELSYILVRDQCSHQKRLPTDSPDAELLAEKLDSSAFLVGDEVDEWKRQIIKGNEIVATMLLYTFLPKVQKLCIRLPVIWGHRDARLLTRTLSAIAISHQNNTKRTSALGCLRYVSLHSPCGSSGGWSGMDLSSLLALPQISAISLFCITIPPLERNLDFARSTITSLILMNCVAERDVISSLLSNTPCLQRFCFLSEWGRTSDDDYHYILDTLRFHTPSLKFLGLPVSYDNRQSLPQVYHTPYMHLGSFESLQAVYIPWAYLAGSLEKDASLSKTLMPNLRLLSIGDGLHDPVADNFHEFIKEQTNRLPSLKRLLCVKVRPNCTPCIPRDAAARAMRESYYQGRLECAAARCGLDVEFRYREEVHNEIVCRLDERWRTYL